MESDVGILCRTGRVVEADLRPGKDRPGELDIQTRNWRTASVKVGHSKDTSMDDPTPLLGIVANSVASFSIGFAKLRVNGKQEDATLAGSGALVTVGPIRGILTAAHVLEELPDRGQVGLIRFTTNPVLQKQSIDMYLTDRLTIGGEHNGADGPDIGFLRLASHQAATLDATNVFFNLSKREESANCGTSA